MAAGEESEQAESDLSFENRNVTVFNEIDIPIQSPVFFGRNRDKWYDQNLKMTTKWS